MTSSSVPRPSCCVDALLNWACWSQYPHDLTRDELDPLPANCSDHPPTR